MDSPLANKQISELRPGGGRTRAPLRAGARPRLRQWHLGRKLAARGWEVTGVDLIPKALRRARERAREAGVELRLIEGDVTALGSADVGSGFQLLLDFDAFTTN